VHLRHAQNTKLIIVMTITNNFASKLAVAFVAIAMVLTLVPSARAAEQTPEELQKTINDLLAQVAALQAQTGGSSAGSSSCEMIPAPLTMGATGASVTALQNRLIADGEAIAAGATGYFGAQTKAALASWQTKNAVSPAVGYYGPITKAAMDAKCTPSDDGDDDDTDSSTELSGEASLESVEVDDADESDVYEGDESAEVAEITVEFTDGDASISRLDVALTDNEGTDSDPWDVFEEITLWVDGEEVASADASDEDNYLGNEDDGIVRFSGLDIVAMEDEEVVITVGATINTGLEAAELGDWKVMADSIRFFDADGVATTDESPSSEFAIFNIDEEGAGDDLELRKTTDFIDAQTLALDTDDNTEHDVFKFKLDANDSEGDVTLENVTIDLALGSSTRDLNEVVKNVTIDIDGDTFEAEDFDGGAATEAVDFDIDGDVTIDMEESVEVTVTVEFEDMDGDSDLQGTTLTASVDTTDIDAEGDSGEAITVGGTDQNGDDMTLRSEGLVLDLTSITATESTKTVSDTTFDYGVFVYKFDVTAFGEDFYVDEDGSTADFDLEIDGTASTTGYTASLKITDASDAATSDYVIEEGETASFVLTIETNTNHDGEAQVIFNGLTYSAADDGSEELSVTATPADDWESDKLILN
jgi:hypothetical protein